MAFFERLSRLCAAALIAACSGTVEEGKAPSAVQPGGQCAPDGERKPSPDGCNSCTCIEGSWACTARACVEQCPAPRPPPPNVRCAGLVVFAKSPESGACCEYESPCFVPEGWSYHATESECRNAGTECQPGERKASDDGCNSCSCGPDGLWACTARACSCTSGQTRRASDGCNTCTCNAEGTWGGCTEIGCGGGTVGCGGWLGDRCTDDEYCAYEPGQMCGAADASAICRPRPQACDLVYDPVCGCDGKAYGNACEAAMSGKGILSLGQCS